ncbi:hypothetical protein SCWH03_28400 [Streptomyces pacificus]|uniref:Uncharacterized protein n=1 Tax=Streptomyces pacificus TaxID=2705029 RepID=A0A6A0AUG2_9ACTN|nr:hypothetical protein SCWH03_28400 [Streptomyces pacificus]
MILVDTARRVRFRGGRTVHAIPDPGARPRVTACGQYPKFAGDRQDTALQDATEVTCKGCRRRP